MDAKIQETCDEVSKISSLIDFMNDLYESFRRITPCKQPTEIQMDVKRIVQNEILGKPDPAMRDSMTQLRMQFKSEAERCPPLPAMSKEDNPLWNNEHVVEECGFRNLRLNVESSARVYEETSIMDNHANNERCENESPMSQEDCSSPTLEQEDKSCQTGLEEEAEAEAVPVPEVDAEVMLEEVTRKNSSILNKTIQRKCSKCQKKKDLKKALGHFMRHTDRCDQISEDKSEDSRSSEEGAEDKSDNAVWGPMQRFYAYMTYMWSPEEKQSFM